MEFAAVPFSKILLYHDEIGVHRGRKYGFRAVFGLKTLREMPFLRLARLVKHAYTEKHIPSHKGWPAQQEALRWFVAQGREGIYALDPVPLRVQPRHSHFALLDGHHRALALYILGEEAAPARQQHVGGGAW